MTMPQPGEGLPDGLRWLVERCAAAGTSIRQAEREGWAGPDDLDSVDKAESLLAQAVIGHRRAIWHAWLACDINCGCAYLLSHAAAAASSWHGCRFVADAVFAPHLEWIDDPPSTLSRALASMETAAMLNAAGPDHAEAAERVLRRMGLVSHTGVLAADMQVFNEDYDYEPGEQICAVFAAPPGLRQDWVLPGPAGFTLTMQECSYPNDMENHVRLLERIVSRRELSASTS